MTKKEIVIKIAEETELKQIDVKMVVQKTLDHIVEALAKSETVELRNFGIFKVKSRKSRVGRNPKTGVTVPIPEKRIVSFKPGMIMKKRVMK
ncbi:MAG: integration host factor subunit beta [Candidatus Omnitrophica bacterium]|nr:integration host factor subunit beta [Candidatus Omnitrophota bacterium]